jgi:hypothetical protein
VYAGHRLVDTKGLAPATLAKLSGLAASQRLNLAPLSAPAMAALLRDVLPAHWRGKAVADMADPGVSHVSRCGSTQRAARCITEAMLQLLACQVGDRGGGLRMLLDCHNVLHHESP